MLAPLGIELIVVPLSGWSIHLDGHLSMVDRDKALCDVHRLPYWFPDRLRELGIELIERQPDEHWAINGLAVRPGRIVLSEGQPRTLELLDARGVEVLRSPTPRSSRAAAASTAPRWSCGATAPRACAPQSTPPMKRVAGSEAPAPPLAGITAIRAAALQDECERAAVGK